MRLYVIRYAEIALKGKNRSWFEKILVNNIKNHLKANNFVYNVWKIYGRMLVEVKAESPEEDQKVQDILSFIPGIQNFSLAIRSTHDLDEIKKEGLALVTEELAGTEADCSFRIESRRSFKQFPMKSQELNIELGGAILEQFPNLKVQMKDAELQLGVEIWDKERSILFLKKVTGQGGLPVGCSGNVLSFLSGGIDSPVSSWMMMNRGCKIIYLNFDSYPFTSEQSKQKVEDLVEQLSRFQVKSTLLVVPFANIQRAIKKQCNERNRTILYRRLMFAIANEIAETYRIKAYITGEAVAQVASQTLENLACTQDAANLPILRPLIGMEKAMIMDFAKKIGTYPISIQPYDDCCTVFQPRKPETKGDVENIRKDEAHLDEQALIQEAVEGIEKIEVDTQVTRKFWGK